MTIYDDILIIANQLANEGKSPSVALVKAKLSKSVPLPVIIQTLKSWQHDPTFVSLKVQDKNQNADNETVLEQQNIKALIQEALAPIEKELSNIKKLLIELSSQENSKP